MTFGVFYKLVLGPGLIGTDLGSGVIQLSAATSGGVTVDTLWDAKGDLAAGTGANTAARLPVGTNGQVLTADSTTTTGLKWAAAAGGDPATDTHVWMPLVDSTGVCVLDSTGGLIPTLIGI